MVLEEEFFGRVFGVKILEEKEKYGVVTEEERKLQEGVNSRAKKKLQSRNKEPAIGFIGIWDRKLAGFLGLAGLTLVDRMDHPIWYQGSNQREGRL